MTQGYGDNSCCGCYLWIAVFVCLALALGLGIAGGSVWPHNWALLGPGIAFGAICVILVLGALCVGGGCC